MPPICPHGRNYGSDCKPRRRHAGTGGWDCVGFSSFVSANHRAIRHSHACVEFLRNPLNQIPVTTYNCPHPGNSSTPDPSDSSAHHNADGRTIRPACVLSQPRPAEPLTLQNHSVQFLPSSIRLAVSVATGEVPRDPWKPTQRPRRRGAGAPRRLRLPLSAELPTSLSRNRYNSPALTTTRPRILYRKRQCAGRSEPAASARVYLGGSLPFRSPALTTPRGSHHTTSQTIFATKSIT